MKDRGIYEVGRPFLVEVVFTGDDINKETDSLLCRAMARGNDLLPGLKVNKIYVKFATEEIAAVESFREDLDDLKKRLEYLLDKYGYYKDDLRRKAIDAMEKED